MHAPLKLFIAAIIATQSAVIGYLIQDRAALTQETLITRAALHISMGLADRALEIIEHNAEQLQSANDTIHVLHREVLRGKLERFITRVNHRADAPRIARAIVAAAEQHGLDPVWITAAMHQESHFDDRALGAAGERGLMQITKHTARYLGLAWQTAWDIEQNIEAGARYLAEHYRRFGRYDRALKRYNGGWTHVRLVEQRRADLLRFL